MVIEEKLEWEFDRIDGQRRVLGVGATAKVRVYVCWVYLVA